MNTQQKKVTFQMQESMRKIRFVVPMNTLLLLATLMTLGFVPLTVGYWFLIAKDDKISFLSAWPGAAIFYLGMRSVAMLLRPYRFGDPRLPKKGRLLVEHSFLAFLTILADILVIIGNFWFLVEDYDSISQPKFFFVLEGIFGVYFPLFTYFDIKRVIYTYRYLQQPDVQLVPAHVPPPRIDLQPQAIIQPHTWSSNHAETDPEGEHSVGEMLGDKHNTTYIEKEKVTKKRKISITCPMCLQMMKEGKAVPVCIHTGGYGEISSRENFLQQQSTDRYNADKFTTDRLTVDKFNAQDRIIGPKQYKAEAKGLDSSPIMIISPGQSSMSPTRRPH